MSQIADLVQVSESQKVQVLAKYQLDENDVRDYIETLRNWLKKQQHLPQDIEDDRLRMFLNRNKYRVEKTKKQIDAYFTLRGLYPSFLANFDPEETADARKSVVFLPLPKLTANNERIIIFNILEDSNVDFFDFPDVIRNYLMVAELWFLRDCSAGERILIDAKGFSFARIKRMELGATVKAHKLNQEAYSGRFAGIDILNSSPTFDTILMLLKMCIAPKLFERIRIHGSLDSLHEVIPTEVLPEEYGGKERSCAKLQAAWGEELMFQKDYLKEISQKISDEKLRAGKLPYNDMFGSEGSFKKLTID